MTFRSGNPEVANLEIKKKSNITGTEDVIKKTKTLTS